MTSYTLQSNNPADSVELRRLEQHRWKAVLTCRGLVATADVWLGQGWVPTEGQVDGFLDSLAADWRGWQGERTWSSDEGEMDIAATHDQLGTVKLRVRLRDTWGEDDWQAEASIFLDSGALGESARDLKAALSVDREGWPEL